LPASLAREDERSFSNVQADLRDPIANLARKLPAHPDTVSRGDVTFDGVFSFGITRASKMPAVEIAGSNPRKLLIFTPSGCRYILFPYRDGELASP